MSNEPVLIETKEAQLIAPDQFIQRAIDKGADVSVLSGLFDLKQRYEASEAKKAFVRAMQKFQETKPVLTRTKVIKFGNTEYSICPLPEMEKMLKEPLADCGLTYRWENSEKEGRFGITCVVTHIEGHSENTTMYADADSSGSKNAIQSIGSTSTYLMRYTLVAALGLTSADQDDDGQASGDALYPRLLSHNKVLRNRLMEVQAVIDFIATGELQEACEIVYSWTEEEQLALWVAPSNGGIFSTQERKIMKESPEWAAARKDYLENK